MYSNGKHKNHNYYGTTTSTSSKNNQDNDSLPQDDTISSNTDSSTKNNYNTVLLVGSTNDNKNRNHAIHHDENNKSNLLNHHHHHHHQQQQQQQQNQQQQDIFIESPVQDTMDEILFDCNNNNDDENYFDTTNNNNDFDDIDITKKRMKLSSRIKNKTCRGVLFQYCYYPFQYGYNYYSSSSSSSSSKNTNSSKMLIRKKRNHTNNDNVPINVIAASIVIGIVLFVIGIIVLYQYIQSHLEYRGYQMKVEQIRRAKYIWSHLQLHNKNKNNKKQTTLLNQQKQQQNNNNNNNEFYNAIKKDNNFSNETGNNNNNEYNKKEHYDKDNNEQQDQEEGEEAEDDDGEAGSNSKDEEPFVEHERWSERLQRQFDHDRTLLLQLIHGERSGSSSKSLGNNNNIRLTQNNKKHSNNRNNVFNQQGEDRDEENHDAATITSIDTARTRIRALLQTWSEEYDNDIINNVNGGIRWIRPYLLPPNPDNPSKYDDDNQRNENGNGDNISNNNNNREQLERKMRMDRILRSRNKEMKYLFFSNRMAGGGGGGTSSDRIYRRMKWEDVYDELVQNGTIDNGPTFDYTNHDYYAYPNIDHLIASKNSNNDVLSTITTNGSYPPLQTLATLMKKFPQDEDYPINKLPIQETLYHFDYMNQTQLNIAAMFRDMELPFKVYNVPEVTAASIKWTDEYVSTQFDGGRGHYKQQQQNHRKLNTAMESDGSITTTTTNYDSFKDILDFGLFSSLRQTLKHLDPDTSSTTIRSTNNQHRRLSTHRSNVGGGGGGGGRGFFRQRIGSSNEEEIENEQQSTPSVLAKGTAQESVNNYFAFFIPQSWIVETMGLPPVRNNDWTYQKWSQHAKYADVVSLDADMPHFYWQAGVGPDERQTNPSHWTFISKDLKSFSSTKENFFLFHPENQKGIQCRFGERGVVAATHYDGGRNMVAMITGAKRYILSPPNNCSHLGIFTSKRSPIFRHSLLNFGHIKYIQKGEEQDYNSTNTNSTAGNVQKQRQEEKQSQDVKINISDNYDDNSSSNHHKNNAGTTMSNEERAWLQRAATSYAVETILKAGEVLYIPSHWFHYIVSVQKSAQCNVRSGIETKGNPNFGGRKDVEECIDDQAGVEYV